MKNKLQKKNQRKKPINFQHLGEDRKKLSGNLELFNKHPFLKEYGNGIAIALVATALIYGWEYSKNEFFSVLTIKPNTITVNCSGKTVFSKEILYLYLTNNSSEPIYGIQIDSTYPKGMKVDLSPEKNEMIGVGPYNIGTTSSVIGYNDKGGFTLALINNLAPKETTKVKLEVDKSSCTNNFVIELKPKFTNKTNSPIYHN